LGIRLGGNNQRMKSRWSVRLSLLGLCGLTIGACSSGTAGNGESAKSATRIIADAKNATSSLQTLHVAGTFSNAAFNSIDLNVGQTHGGGSVKVNQQQISVYADQNRVYLYAAPSTWLALSKNPASQKLGNRWVEFPSGSAIFTQFGVNSVQKLIDGTLNQSPKSLTKGPITTFQGRKAIPLRAGNQTIYVAEEGPPYLLGLQSAGTVTFDQFNTAVVPSAPATSTPAADLIK